MKARLYETHTLCASNGAQFGTGKTDLSGNWSWIDNPGSNAEIYCLNRFNAEKKFALRVSGARHALLAWADVKVK